jgi:hypothetical protein
MEISFQYSTRRIYANFQEVSIVRYSNYIVHLHWFSCETDDFFVPLPHNLKVVGSNPTPATNITDLVQYVTSRLRVAFFVCETIVEALWKQ